MTMRAAAVPRSPCSGRHRQAHLRADAVALTRLFADDLVSVARRRELSAEPGCQPGALRAYFAQVRSAAWDGLEDPLIEVSGDGTLATVLVHKLSYLTFEGDDGAPEEEVTISGWAETWRRMRDRWELAMVISTSKHASRRCLIPRGLVRSALTAASRSMLLHVGPGRPRTAVSLSAFSPEERSCPTPSISQKSISEALSGSARR